jgi:hypothetical protein
LLKPFFILLGLISFLSHSFDVLVLFPGLEKDLEAIAQTSLTVSRTVEQKGTELRELSDAVADLFRDLDMVDVPQSGPCKP